MCGLISCYSSPLLLLMILNSLDYKLLFFYMYSQSVFMGYDLRFPLFIWFSLMFKCYTFSGLVTGIYSTNSPEACHYVAEAAKCNVIVVENDILLQKILKVRDRLPHLKAIVQYTGDLKQRYDDVYTVSRRLCIMKMSVMHFE